MMSVTEALKALLAEAARFNAAAKPEYLPLYDAAGRVLAADLIADVDVPPMDNSQMDGYAVRAADVVEAGAVLPVSMRIMAGHAPSQPLSPGTAARIFTGAPMPIGADCVVMQEQCESVGDAVRILALPNKGEFVRLQGFDIPRGAAILHAGTRLTGVQLALAASVGVATVAVAPKVRVGAFFTGDELRMPGEPLAPGQIYNSNRFMLKGLCLALGCDYTDFGTVPDNEAQTRATLQSAAKVCDLIITCGGVSVGEADFVKPAVEAMGRLGLWKVAIKPGKPLASGVIQLGEREVLFVGLPGNPVSSFVTFEVLVRPMILRMSGVLNCEPKAMMLPAAFARAKPDAREEYLRGRVNLAGGIEVHPNQNSAALSSVAWAEGLVCVPAGACVQEGDLLAWYPYLDR